MSRQHTDWAVSRPTRASNAESENDPCFRCEHRYGKEWHCEALAVAVLKRMVWLFVIATILVLAGPGCKSLPEDRSSAFAAEAGHPTMALGGCVRPLTTGWEGCVFEKDAPLPALRLFFTNQAEYMVADCHGAVMKQGSANQPGEVPVDLSVISDQLKVTDFCILTVEAIEYYSDPRDKKQRQPIPLIGGFHISMVDKGYMPIPNPDVIAWCYKVQRTTKGRTIVEACK